MRTSESLSAVNTTSKMIARYSVCYVSQHQGDRDMYSALSDGLRCAMQSMLDDILAKHEDDFSILLGQLPLDPGRCCVSLETVLREMISDGVYNWGRFITVCGFSGAMAKTCTARNNDTQTVSKIAETCEEFAITRFGEWIDDQGGWETFERQFATQKGMLTWYDLLRQGVSAVASAVSVR